MRVPEECANVCRTNADPINPAPPVTRSFI
jgi:hypothetical protein